MTEGSTIWRGEVHHIPWPLLGAEASIETNTMAVASGIELPNEASHLLFAQELQVPEKVRT